MNFGTDNRLPRYTQWLNYSIALASLLVVVLGSLYNSEGLKHSIAKVPAQYSSSIYHTLPHCSKRVLVLNLHDSILCCDEGNRDHDWLCYASFDRLSRLLSHSTWAWLLPLLPLALSYLADCAHLVLFDKSLAHFMSVTRSAARRMLFYFSLVLFRSFVLYLIPLQLTHLFSHSGQHTVEVDNCWCKDFVSKSKCMMQFDFSDHIVLFVAQYITPALLELDYLLVHRLSGTTGRNSSSANSVYLLPVVLCALSIFISLRAAFFTCLYFHTPAENLVGFAFAASCTLLPLCLHPGTVRWWLTQFNKE